MDVLPAQPTQDVPKLPEGTSGTIQAIVYGSFALILLLGALGRYFGGRTTGTAKKSDPPQPDGTGPPTSVTATVTGTVAQQAEASQALMERLVAGLEKRLDDALSTQRDIQTRYDRDVDELRAQLSAEQQEKWQLSSRLQDLNRQLEDARTEVIRLRAELAAVRPQRGGW